MLTAIKEITYIRNHQLTIHIPEEFQYKKVEVLILPYETSNASLENNSLMDKVFKDAQNTTIPAEVNIDELMKDMNNALS